MQKGIGERGDDGGGEKKDGGKGTKKVEMERGRGVGRGLERNGEREYDGAGGHPPLLCSPPTATLYNPPRRSSFGHLHPVTTVLLLITSLSEFCVILYCTRDISDSILFYSNSTDSL